MLTALFAFVCFGADPAPPPSPPRPQAQVRGIVLAKGTRDALAGASIAVDAVPVTEADADGRFEIAVEPGRRHIQVQHPGFDPLDTSITATVDAEPRELTLRLMPRQTGERYETVVTSTEEEATATSLREDDLTKTPGSLGDPFRVIESLPGVSQVVWPLAMYAVRGANPGNTGFFLDGVRMPALFHFALGPSVIHPFFLDQMDFYPGGYPLRFGRYVSGVVSAETKAPAVDRPHASTDVRLFDAGGIVATPWDGGKGTLAVAGRYSYTGLLLSQFSPDYTLNYWDYQLRADHVLGSGRATVFAFGSGDVLGRKEVTDENTASISFHRLTLRWTGTLLGGRLEAGGVIGRDASATSIKAITSLPLSVSALTASSRVHYAHPLASWVDVQLGGDGEAQQFRPHSEKTVEGIRPDLFLERDTIAAGSYVGLTLRSRSWVSFSPGFRYDVFREEHVTRLEPGPRVELTVRPTDEVSIKAMAGRFAQMASLPVAVPGFDGFGLATFGTQSSRQGSLGVQTKLGERLSLDVTGFYQRLRVTDLASMFNLDPQGTILELRDGESYGGEIMLRRPSHHRLFGWLAYTLSWSNRLIGGYQAKAPSDWDQRHILNLVAGYRLRGGYTLGARLHYNTGRPYPIYDEHRQSAPVEYQRLAPFYQLDLRGDRRFVFDRYVMDVYVELINSTLTREVFDLRRDYDGSVMEKAYRIVLPSVGIHAEW